MQKWSESGLFHTPKDMEDMNKRIEHISNIEFTMGAMLMWNLCCKMHNNEVDEYFDSIRNKLSDAMEEHKNEM